MNDFNEIILTPTTECVIGQPGCYGYVAAFNGSEACQSCKWSEGCQNKAATTLQKMQERRIEVSKLVAQHRAFRAAKKQPALALNLATTLKRAPVVCVVSAEQQAQIDALPKKVGVELRKIFERGIAFRADLQAGTNPITQSGGKPAYLALACDLLLKDGFTRVTLRDAYIKAYRWEFRTACSHVTIVAGLLPALGIPEKEGTFAL